MNKTRLGIRFRLVILMLALIVIPLAITGYFLATINQEAIQVQVKENSLAMSDHIQEITRYLLHETTREINIILRLLNDSDLDTDRALSLIKHQIASSQRIQFVNIYDSQGDFLDSILPVGSTLPMFSPRTLDGGRLNYLMQNDRVLGEVFLDKSIPYLPLFFAWKTDQQFNGVLWTAINIKSLSHKMNEMVTIHFSALQRAFLIDQGFTIVAHSEWNKVRENLNIKDSALIKKIFPSGSIPQVPIGLSSDFEDVTGQWLVSVHTIPELEWTLLVFQNRSIAYASLIQMQQKIVIFGGLFMIAAALLGTWTARRLTQPILEVAAGARELALQNFSHRIHVRRKDEIGEMAQTFNFLGESLEEYVSRIKKEVSIRTDLSRYLSPEIVEAIVEQRANLELGGKKQNVTVLYADIVNFTPLTETLSPEAVVALLNELFTILTQIIFRNGGMIDKFIGDCVMALFGAPDEDPHAAQKAVKTAIDMITWLEVGNKKWKREYGRELQLAISIHCGGVIIGNVGSKKRMEFTVIGDAINTAARMEKIAQPNQILISTEIEQQIKDTYKTNPVGRFQLRGKDNRVDLHEIVV